MNTKFSIGVVVAIVLQISGFVWWTAQQSQTINILSVKVAGLTSSASVVETTNFRRDIRELQTILTAMPELIQSDLQELEDEMNDIATELRSDLEKIRDDLRKKRKQNNIRKEIRSDADSVRDQKKPNKKKNNNIRNQIKIDSATIHNETPEERRKRRKLERKALKQKF